MPFESLSCQRCGSGDIQEVKPETYFCNHCESVFKYVSPSRAGVASGGCEVLAGRRPCGVPAIGRCRTCQRAFCRTHQARAARGIENLLDSEVGAAAHGALNGYVDWCEVCRSAEFAKADGKEKPALDQPFGRFLEDRFFPAQSSAGTSAYSPEGQAVNDLVAAADRALEEYPCETAETMAAPIRDKFQLADGQVIDCSALAGIERITRLRRLDGNRFYIYDSHWANMRVRGTFTNVWIAGGSRMLVATCSMFNEGSNSRGSGYRPPLIRYTDVEEVGVSRMESIAGSFARYFPPLALPGEARAAGKAGKRRWFR